MAECIVSKWTLMKVFYILQYLVPINFYSQVLVCDSLIRPVIDKQIKYLETFTSLLPKHLNYILIIIIQLLNFYILLDEL